MSKECQCLLAGQIEVPYEGNLEADIIFVLESPGREEVIQKRPAVGDAGIQWESVINEFGFQRKDVFIINPARCRMDKQALGQSGIKKVVAACRGALVTAVQHIKPKIIVCCGGIASHSVTGVTVAGVKNRRGKWEYSQEFNCQVLHTLHPSFTLRDPSQLPFFKQDIQELRRVVDANFEVKRHEVFNYKEVDSIRFLLDRNPEVVGFDTETQGLKWFDDDFVPISYSVSDEKGQAYQIVLWEEGTEKEHYKQIVYPRDKQDTVIYIKKAKNHDQKMEGLRELCGNENIKKYVMTSYDEHVMDSMGITDQKGFVLDVQIGAHVLNSDVYRNAHLADLENIFSDIDSSYNYTFADNYKKEDMLWSLKQDREAFNTYSCADSDGTRRVGLNIKEELMKDELNARYYVKMVHPITKTVLYNLSKNGMLVDVDRLPSVSADIKIERDRLEAECLAVIPEAVKQMDKHKNQLEIKGSKRPLNRGLFIADTLFSDKGFGLKPLGYTPKKGDPKVDQDTLLQVKLKANKTARKFIDLKLERDEYHILYTRYIKNIELYTAKDNRVHPSFSTTFTVTGRVGARTINSMNLPKRRKQAKLIRSLFIVPQGSSMLNVDASQAELRWIAHESQDTRMLEAYRNDEDLHTTTALSMLMLAGKVIEDLSSVEMKEARQNAKPANFGLSFGMSAYGYREYALNDFGVSMTQKQATESRNAWFTLYPGVAVWHEKAIQEMYRDGGVRHAFGRFRHLPNLFSKDDGVRHAAEREGVNAKIQGPSSDAVLYSGYKMYDDGFIDRPEIKLVNFVHDNLTFEVRGTDSYKESLAREVVDRMSNSDFPEFGFSLSVPMKADAELGPNLAELEELKL